MNQEAYDKICREHNITPRFTRTELQDFTVKKLKVIRSHWGHSRSPRLKTPLIEAILNDPHNVDPDWVTRFRDA